MGKRVPQAPDWAINAALRYGIDGSRIGVPGRLTFDADWQYVGKRVSDIQNAVTLPSYHNTNLRLEWRSGAVGVHTFARNLFDERPVSYGVAYLPDVTANIVGRGRVLGAGASQSW